VTVELVEPDNFVEGGARDEVVESLGLVRRIERPEWVPVTAQPVVADGFEPADRLCARVDRHASRLQPSELILDRKEGLGWQGRGHDLGI
jgi:hypothetical protein